MDYLTTSKNPNKVQKMIRKVLCLKCYEKYIDIYSENYFTISYLGSLDFLPANKVFYYLSERYCNTFYNIFLLGLLFGTLGKVMIALLTTWFGYLIYLNS